MELHELSHLVMKAIIAALCMIINFESLIVLRRNSWHAVLHCGPSLTAMHKDFLQEGWHIVECSKSIMNCV